MGIPLCLKINAGPDYHCPHPEKVQGRGQCVVDEFIFWFVEIDP